MGIPLFNYGEDVFIRGVFARREARWLHMVPTTKRTKPGRANILAKCNKPQDVYKRQEQLSYFVLSRGRWFL